MLLWGLSTPFSPILASASLSHTEFSPKSGHPKLSFQTEAPALAACLGGERQGLGSLPHPKVRTPASRGAWHHYLPALFYQSCSALYRITWARRKERDCKHACIGTGVGRYICTQYRNPAATSGRSDGNALRTPYHIRP